MLEISYAGCLGLSPFQPFRLNSFLKCVPQLKIAKKSLKAQILEFKIVQGHRFWCTNCLSQCSTVVRNTVVRATIKVNGKPQILGIYSPQTSKSINLKFALDDYVGRLPKMVQIGSAGSARQRVKYDVQK